VAGLLSDSGAAACPRPMGGSPPVAGAAAGLLPRYQQAGGTGRNGPAAPPAGDGRAVLRSPGSLLTVKDHHQGRACGASPLRGADP
jgi:hypothetical protein